MGLKDGVESFVRFGLVPALLGVGLVSAGISAGQAYPRARAAAYGGFWAGVLAVAALVLVLQGTPRGPLPFDGPPAAIGEVLAGVAVGSWTTLGYIWFRDRAWIALPLGLQAGGSLSLIYLFLVWPAARSDISWLIVGIAPAATLFYALYRDTPPKPRRARGRAQVAAVSDASSENPDPRS